MGKPLNPDGPPFYAELYLIHSVLLGLSGWSNNDPNFKDHCTLIKDSCAYLYNSLIPELARSLNWEPSESGLDGLIEDEGSGVQGTILSC